MYTYAQAETVLARLYGADEQAQLGAFRGRLKHLKRVNIPLNMSPGRGAKVAYTREHVFQWAVCLEFSEFGFDPVLTSKFIHKFWHIFVSHLRCIDNSEEKDDDVIFQIY